MTIELSTNMHFSDLFRDAKPNELYVDVGGFDGDTIRHARLHQPGLRIIAVEPILSSAQKIRDTYSDVMIFNTAASDHDGKLKLHSYAPPYEGCSTSQAFMKEAHAMGSVEIEVPCFRLDTMLMDAGIGTVDYVKIDTEGAEESVLRGFTLYRPGTRFHVEYHVNNLAGILYQLKMMNVEATKITLAKDAVKKDVTVGYVLGIAR